MHMPPGMRAVRSAFGGAARLFAYKKSSLETLKHTLLRRESIVAQAHQKLVETIKERPQKEH